MKTTVKRLWFYGLLLVLPALAMGGLALGLLAREQTRLAEREEAAAGARRAAVETRARLIAENIELLVADVQSTLMTKLLEAPAAEPRFFLTEWQAGNPLVRDVFRVTAQGRPVWGPNTETTRNWLSEAAPWLGGTSVSANNQTKALDEAMETKTKIAAAPPEQTDSLARQEISANVLQFNSTRQALQEVARGRTQTEKKIAAAETQSFAGVNATAAPPASAPVAGRADYALDPVPLVRAIDFGASLSSVETETVLSGISAPGAAKALAESAQRADWSTWRDADGLHVFGWRELPDKSYVGLELGLDEIKRRLGEVFPAASAGEAFTLRDDRATHWHTTRRAGIAYAMVAEVPLREAFAGWAVLGYIEASAYALSSGRDFFTLGATLIGLLVIAILSAGALLLRQAQRSELEAAQRTSFVANVSHELKTPLTTIRLYAELLAQGRVRDESKRADYLATIGLETQRLARLVGNVLDFSRLEQGKKKYAREPLNLAEDLRRLGETHAPRLAAAGLTLAIEAPEHSTISTDRDAVEQIVLNLFDNACKYASGGGEVLLALDAPGDGTGFRVRVADRGPGVPAAERERIFEKFHRGDERLTAEKSGAGLGLSIARQLARGLGGDLVCTDREGGGAEFVLTLPDSP